MRIDSVVLKQLKKIPRRYAERIFEVIRSFAINPYAGDIEKMKGEDALWRRRVGSYRVFYEVDGAKKIITVFDVRRRTSNTY
ncbi:type II toxin-antitoxin system RelE/ParE family toxin [Candidatus Uhrbacteria bacterium]|nr:type II toxin-antitoxin system RelE/ParE family toxin [Candidatus Uhrbacteria bacterium]